MRRLLVPDDDADVYASLAPELIRFATGLVGRQDAQDLLATAVLHSLASPTWPTINDRRSYLYRAVFNEAQRSRRRSAMRREREHHLGSVHQWYLPEFQPEVRAAVEALSMRQRAVIILTYWDDLDPKGIASRLGIAEGSVRRHLARARARLREVLHG